MREVIGYLMVCFAVIIGCLALFGVEMSMKDKIIMGAIFMIFLTLLTFGIYNGRIRKRWNDENRFM